MGLVAKPALRADAVAVAHQEHADHQLRVDGGPPDRAVERRQLGPQPRQVQCPIKPPEQVVRGDVPLQAELVEEPRPLDLTPHPLKERES